MRDLKLGLVCISEMLRDTNRLSFKTITRKSYNKAGCDAGLITLSRRILHNTCVIRVILEHCHTLGIVHYRMSSDTFPLVTDPTLGISMDDLPDIIEIKSNLLAAGDYARRVGITCSSHPSAFNVLCSYSETVVKNSITELNHQSDVLEIMGFSPDFKTPMCLHLSCAPRLSVECLNSYVSRFLNNLSQCNIGVQSRLVLENEDKGYWNAAALYANFGDLIPLVYDNLHDKCNPSSGCMVAQFKSTWRGFTPVFHWSEGIESSNKHTARASHIPSVVNNNRDCIWEVEIKDKDYAILEIFDTLL